MSNPTSEENSPSNPFDKAKKHGKLTLLRHEASKSLAAKRELEAREWMSTQLQEDSLLDDKPFHDILSDGIFLCRLANSISNNLVPKIHVTSSPEEKLPSFRNIQNVLFFLQACTSLGVPNQDLFTPPDLIDNRDMSRVVDTLLSLYNQVKLRPVNKHASRKTIKRWGRMDSWIKQIEDPPAEAVTSTTEPSDAEKLEKMGPSHRDIKISRIHVSDIFKQETSPPNSVKSPLIPNKKEQKRLTSGIQPKIAKSSGTQLNETTSTTTSTDNSPTVDTSQEKEKISISKKIHHVIDKQYLELLYQFKNL